MKGNASIFSADKGVANKASMAGSIGTQAAGMLDMLSPTPQGFDASYQQSGTLSALDTASNIAMSSGNPYAMAGAGVYKLAKTATGDFGQKAKFEAEQDRRRSNWYSSKLQKEQKEIMSGFKTSGILNSEMYAFGGPLNGLDVPEYIEFEGPSHEKGGIKYQGDEFEGGEVMYNNYVFSKRLGFAKPAKKIARRGFKNYSKRNSTDPIAKNTASRQQMVNEAELTDLMNQQEEVRTSLGLN